MRSSQLSLAGLLAASTLLLGLSTQAQTAGAGSDTMKSEGECHGVNACKGKGDCGGKGHSCAGKNSCKGKGWVKTDKDLCDKLGGKYKAEKG